MRSRYSNFVPPSLWLICVSHLMYPGLLDRGELRLFVAAVEKWFLFRYNSVTSSKLQYQHSFQGTLE